MGPDFDVRSLYGNSNPYKKNDRWKGFNSGIYRASELQTPANPGHFLQEFGQSDREVAENSNQDASVPQALTLLNGTFYGALFNKNSPFMKKLAKAETPQEKIEVLFLSILNRKPTALETSACIDELSPSALSPLPISQEIPDRIAKDKRKAYKKNIEKSLAQALFNKNREYFALAWSLINTRQFSFIQ
jgi:hypothetical protein